MASARACWAQKQAEPPSGRPLRTVDHQLATYGSVFSFGAATSWVSGVASNALEMEQVVVVPSWAHLLLLGSDYGS